MGDEFVWFVNVNLGLCQVLLTFFVFLKHLGVPLTIFQFVHWFTFLHPRQQCSSRHVASIQNSTVGLCRKTPSPGLTLPTGPASSIENLDIGMVNSPPKTPVFNPTKASWEVTSNISKSFPAFDLPNKDNESQCDEKGKEALPKKGTPVVGVRPAFSSRIVENQQQAVPPTREIVNGPSVTCYTPPPQHDDKTLADGFSARALYSYICAACGGYAEYTCSTCQKVWYCSRKCQVCKKSLDVLNGLLSMLASHSAGKTLFSVTTLASQCFVVVNVWQFLNLL